jgi:hypothetical protein
VGSNPAAPTSRINDLGQKSLDRISAKINQGNGWGNKFAIARLVANGRCRAAISNICFPRRLKLLKGSPQLIFNGAVFQLW